jgi:type IV fimbrial biogenesis protein FimT
MHLDQRGFTLLELLVVIAIAAILTGIAVPSFRAAIRNAEMRDASTAFYSALNRARSEAIAKNASVSICARDIADPASSTCATGSSADTAWSNGWIVYVDATPSEALVVHEPLVDGLTLGTLAGPLSFDATGRVSAETSFSLCRGSGDAQGRRVVITRSGRVALAQDPTAC